MCADARAHACVGAKTRALPTDASVPRLTSLLSLTHTISKMKRLMIADECTPRFRKEYNVEDGIGGGGRPRGDVAGTSATQHHGLSGMLSLHHHHEPSHSLQQCQHPLCCAGSLPASDGLSSTPPPSCAVLSPACFDIPRDVRSLGPPFPANHLRPESCQLRLLRRVGILICARVSVAVAPAVHAARPPRSTSPMSHSTPPRCDCRHPRHPRLRRFRPHSPTLPQSIRFTSTATRR